MGQWKIAVAAPIAVGLVLLGTPAIGQNYGAADLGIGRLAYIQPGTYLAGESIGFSLDPLGGNYLLRFRGAAEVFVLYVDRGTMGGRVLKYDSGETAIMVSGWGGLTLYPDQAPQGLPAVRVSDSEAPSPPSIAVSDMQAAAGDESQRLAYVRRINVQFTADWNALSDNSQTRSYAFDAMENAARGVERATNSSQVRDAFARRISVIAIAAGGRPTLALNGRTLIITFNPGAGFPGRASSRAIARALLNVLSR
ncbi:MAG TPA: DUF4908 domain-containing protein [Rhizomicrobium sp.]|nr:DUF4908 domain-containing protein [Rhizomicrobium sp.]